MKFRYLFVVILLVFSAQAFAQTTTEKKSPTEADKVAVFDKNGEIRRGAEIGESKIVSIKDALADPEKFDGKTVRVDGFVVRSCKMKGCWAEIADAKDSKTSVRVTMKDHAFFIPLKSAGFRAVAEGYFRVKTLDAKHVKHLVEEDGAKFDKINEDGTVTEVAFVANGIVLTKE